MKAIYPGSFGPITNGHLHILDKATKIFDEVIVLVANNPNKKATDLLKRVEVAKLSTAYNPKVQVTSVSHDFVVRRAKELGADFIVRGIRSFGDFEDEMSMYHTNRALEPDIDTIFIMPDIDLLPLRSSTVKSLIGCRRWPWAVKERVPWASFLSLLRDRVEGLFGYPLSPDLDRHYGQKDYHNWEHIVYCLEEYEYFKHKASLTLDPTSSEAFFLILFHDMEPSPEGDVNNQFWDHGRAITKHHDHAPLERDLDRLIHDIDLSVLAWPRDQYVKYMARVRREYQIPQDECRKGRSDFLKSTLDLPRIFELDLYDEAKARENISFELNTLK